MTNMPYNLDPNATTDPDDPITSPEGAGGPPDEPSEDAEATIISPEPTGQATEGSSPD
jgi:hypothetical protein